MLLWHIITLILHLYVYDTIITKIVLMSKAKCQCLLAHKLLLRHLSKQHHHLPLPALCVSKPWHSSTLSIIIIMTIMYIILVQRISRHIHAFFSYTLPWFLGLAVSTSGIGLVDLSSSPMGGSNLARKNRNNYIQVF